MILIHLFGYYSMAVLAVGKLNLNLDNLAKTWPALTNPNPWTLLFVAQLECNIIVGGEHVGRKKESTSYSRFAEMRITVFT
jgi:hypothetical protein